MDEANISKSTGGASWLVISLTIAMGTPVAHADRCQEDRDPFYESDAERAQIQIDNELDSGRLRAVERVPMSSLSGDIDIFATPETERFVPLVRDLMYEANRHLAQIGATTAEPSSIEVFLSEVSGPLMTEPTDENPRPRCDV